MLGHHLVLLCLWHVSATEVEAEELKRLSPLAKNIITMTLGSSGSVMRRDFGNEKSREDSDLRHARLHGTTKLQSHEPSDFDEADTEEEEEGSTTEGPEPDRSDDTTTGEPTELDTTEMPTDSFEPVGTTQETTVSTTLSEARTVSNTTTAGSTASTSTTSPTSSTGNHTAEISASTSTATTTTVTTTTQTPTTTTTTTTSTTTSSTKSSTTIGTHHEVQFTRATTMTSTRPHLTTTTHSPAYFEAIQEGVAAAAAARAQGLTPQVQITRAGEAAAAAAQEAGLALILVVQAAGQAAAAAARGLGLPAVEQVRAAVLAAEIVAQKVGLSAEKEATAAASAALAAAKAAGLGPQEQAEVAGQVVASVRKSLRDVLAGKIEEIHASRSSTKSALDAAAKAAQAAQKAQRAAEEAEAATKVDGTNITPPATNVATGGEDVQAMLKKLAEQVSQTSARLEEIEKHERDFSDELSALSSNKSESQPMQEVSAAISEAMPLPSSPVKIPSHMTPREKPKYWMHGEGTEESATLEKPVRPHNLQDAVVTAEDVATMSPEQVASLLTMDRELLVAVTSKLSSGRNLSDLVFDTDTSKLPKSGPTEQALEYLMKNPEIAKKALNFSLSVLSRGVKKLSSGNALADELFGSNTSHLIGEEVKMAQKSTEMASEEASVEATKGITAASVSTTEVDEEEESVGTTAEEATKVLGLELPSIPLPSLHIFNPMAWFR